jgi:hypothetical protein
MPELSAHLSALPPKLAQAYAENQARQDALSHAPLPAAPLPPAPATSTAIAPTTPEPVAPVAQPTRPLTSDEDFYGHKTVQDTRGEDPNLWHEIYDGS